MQAENGNIQVRGGKPKNKLPTLITEAEEATLSKLIDKTGGFTVCLNCGGTNLEIVPFDESVPTRKYFCRECAYEGGPIIFKNLGAYEKFFRNKRLKYNMTVDQLEADIFLAKPFSPELNKKNPFIALAISLLLPGIGQAYLGQLRKAWAILILAFIAYVSLSVILIGRSFLSQNTLWVMNTPFIIMYIIIIFASMDAYFSATKVNYHSK